MNKKNTKQISWTIIPKRLIFCLIWFNYHFTALVFRFLLLLLLVAFWIICIYLEEFFFLLFSISLCLSLSLSVSLSFCPFHLSCHFSGFKARVVSTFFIHSRAVSIKATSFSSVNGSLKSSSLQREEGKEKNCWW